MTVCLDSWAIMAWLDGDEPAFSRVEGRVGGAMCASWINVVEVGYRVERDHGRRRADLVIDWCQANIGLDVPAPRLMRAVARLKAARPMALADCFAVATAAAYGLPLLTGDPEIIGAPGLPCAVEDLRTA